MRSLITLGLAITALVWAPAALPCGGGFGSRLTIKGDQKIVLTHKDGVETYFFSPHFCGETAGFGLILPVPSPLTSNPALGDSATVSQLEEITRPEVVQQTVCKGKESVNTDGGVGAYSDGINGGRVNVINKGTVGIFDWVLLKADSPQAFTQWLDTNQYPYDASSATQFEHYVKQGWYFVAFKVTADTQAPPAGKQICGDFGPIELSFSASKPVIPARIAAASGGGQDAGSSYVNPFSWRVFSISRDQLSVNASGVISTLRFSGAMSQADLASHGAVAKLAKEGDRLTEIDTVFYAGRLQGDLELGAVSPSLDYRRTETVSVVVDCAEPDGGSGSAGGGGCSLSGSSTVGGSAAIGLALAGLAARLRRRTRSR